MNTSSTVAIAAPRLTVEAAYDAKNQPETIRVSIGDKSVTLSAGEWSSLIARPFILRRTA